MASKSSSPMFPPRTPTDYHTGHTLSSPPKVLPKLADNKPYSSQPPVLQMATSQASSVFIRERERLAIILNLSLMFASIVALFKQTYIEDLVYRKVHVAVSLRRIFQATILLSVLNIAFMLCAAVFRFLRRVFGSVDQRQSKLARGTFSPIQRNVLRDSMTISVKQSPLRSLAQQASASSSSLSQTPLRSPFSKQSPLMAASGSSIISTQLPLTSTLATPKSPSFTPSTKSINLRTPSALLLTSPNSPFSVQTPSEKKMSSLLSTPVEKSSPVTPKSAPATADEKKTLTKKRKDVERRVFRGESCLQELTLQRDFEDRIERLRTWLWTMIIKPLVEDIDKVEAAFQANGMSHLGPLCPASMTLLNASSSPFDLRPAFFASPGTIAASSRPQTLMDLAHHSKHDPMVQTRLRIEKYLDVAAGAGQVAAGPRIALVKRLRALAVSPFVDCSAVDSICSPDDDALLFMHLFCTFLDEHLPSSDLYATQPFSSRYFIPLTDNTDALKIDLLGVPVAIAQSSRQPPNFVLISPEEAFVPVASNPVNSCMHTLVLFVAFVEKRLAGHLGIANLRSRSIRLCTKTDTI